MPSQRNSRIQYHCSFCGKTQDQVRRLIAGPGRGLHLRRVRRAVPRDHRGGGQPAPQKAKFPAARVPTPQAHLRAAQRVRHRPGPGQEGPLRRRLQPLQAHRRRDADRRGRAGEEQHPPRRPHRLRQDPPGPDPGQDPRRALLHRRRHRPHRGRLRRRGRGEHPPPPHPGGGLRHRPRRAGHRLHRRDRQDRPQGGQPLDHPRRLRRGRAAGAAQDHRGHRGQRAAPGRAQAPPPGLHPDQHPQHPVHLRRRLRRAGPHRLLPRRRHPLGRLPPPPRATTARTPRCCAS